MAKIEKPPALGAPMDANIMKRAFVIFVMRHHGHNEETATDLISLLYASREGFDSKTTTNKGSQMERNKH
jgi:hypothetical protein